MPSDAYDIFYIFKDGRKVCVSWPKFQSALDACKSVAMLHQWGLPDNVERVVAEDSNGVWLCELSRNQPKG